MTDGRERELERRAAIGDEGARTELYVSEFRRGARFKLRVLVGREPGNDSLHLVSHRSVPPRMTALCNRLDVRLGRDLSWETWAGPDGTLDEGRCDKCHALVLLLTNDAFSRLFSRQVAIGRVTRVRHPEDDAPYHLGTGRDLKDDEWEVCEACGGSKVHDCYDCSGRGWVFRLRRRSRRR